MLFRLSTCLWKDFRHYLWRGCDLDLFANARPTILNTWWHELQVITERVIDSNTGIEIMISVCCQNRYSLGSRDVSGMYHNKAYMKQGNMSHKDCITRVESMGNADPTCLSYSYSLYTHTCRAKLKPKWHFSGSFYSDAFLATAMFCQKCPRMPHLLIYLSCLWLSMGMLTRSLK